jgi:hypothetical protein
MANDIIIIKNTFIIVINCIRLRERMMPLMIITMIMKTNMNDIGICADSGDK